MRPDPDDHQNERELMLRMLPMSASLSGLCIGAVTLFRTNAHAQQIETIADDLLVVCSAVFLFTTYLAFWSLRTRRPGLMRHLAQVVDVSFLLALTVLVGVGFVMVYTIL